MAISFWTVTSLNSVSIHFTYLIFINTFSSKQKPPKALLGTFGSYLAGATRIWTGAWGFCRPVPYHLAMAPFELLSSFHTGMQPQYAISYIYVPPADMQLGGMLERKTGFEPATSTLARSHSTTESLPHISNAFLTLKAGFKPLVPLRDRLRVPNRLNFGPCWWEQQGSNLWPFACKANALPAELCSLKPPVNLERCAIV